MNCEHGIPRATAQFVSYAGPVGTCSCCRSQFGSLVHPFPATCPGCVSK